MQSIDGSFGINYFYPLTPPSFRFNVNVMSPCWISERNYPEILSQWYVVGSGASTIKLFPTLNASDKPTECSDIWTDWATDGTFNDLSSAYFTAATAPAHWPTVELYVLDNAGNAASETQYTFQAGDGYRFY